MASKTAFDYTLRLHDDSPSQDNKVILVDLDFWT